MPIQRIVVLVLLTLTAVYVAIMQSANPIPVALPGLLPIPLWIVVLVTALVAYLAGWAPATIAAWRLRRERNRLEKRISELESHLPNYGTSEQAPIIPDRTPARRETTAADASEDETLGL